MTIPDQQGYCLGPIDQEAWKPIDLEPPTAEPVAELAAGTFVIGLTMFKPIPKIDPPDVPDLRPFILEEEWVKCDAP